MGTFIMYSAYTVYLYMFAVISGRRYFNVILQFKAVERKNSWVKETAQLIISLKACETLLSANTSLCFLCKGVMKGKLKQHYVFSKINTVY